MTVKEKIQRAFRTFMLRDRYLLEVNANERSLTHRLAIYIEQDFPDYHVDCEYNRVGLDPKRLATFKRKVNSDDIKGVTAFPDIIVHHRGSGNNLVVIEAKTTSNQQTHNEGDNCPCDRCKLHAYKVDHGYQHAVFIIFPFGVDLENYSEAKLADYVFEV